MPFRRLVFGFAMLAVTGPVTAQDPVSWSIVEDFAGDWRDRWDERKLGDGRTVYAAVNDGDGPILVGRAEGSASALVRTVEAPAGAGEISWHWRVASPLPGRDGRSERQREGDDFATRLFVIFGDGRLGPKTRAIVYVWAAREPEGALFRSPYVSSVATIVVQSGESRTGEWVAERRDVAADYRAAFGEEPERIAGLAIMVDADDTDSSATAWFDEIRLTVLPYTSKRAPTP